MSNFETYFSIFHNQHVINEFETFWLFPQFKVVFPSLKHKNFKQEDYMLENGAQNYFCSLLLLNSHQRKKITTFTEKENYTNVEYF